MTWLRQLLAVWFALSVGGCQLVVNFDRSLLEDAGADAGIDAGDAGPDASSDAGPDGASDSGSDASTDAG